MNGRDAGVPRGVGSGRVDGVHGSKVQDAPQCAKQSPSLATGSSTNASAVVSRSEKRTPLAPLPTHAFAAQPGGSALESAKVRAAALPSTSFLMRVELRQMDGTPAPFPAEMLTQVHPLSDVAACRKREKDNFKRHYVRAVKRFTRRLKRLSTLKAHEMQQNQNGNPPTSISVTIPSATGTYALAAANPPNTTRMSTRAQTALASIAEAAKLKLQASGVPPRASNFRFKSSLAPPKTSESSLHVANSSEISSKPNQSPENLTHTHNFSENPYNMLSKSPKSLSPSAAQSTHMKPTSPSAAQSAAATAASLLTTIRAEIRLVVRRALVANLRARRAKVKRAVFNAIVEETTDAVFVHWQEPSVASGSVAGVGDGWGGMPIRAFLNVFGGNIAGAIDKHLDALFGTIPAL